MASASVLPMERVQSEGPAVIDLTAESPPVPGPSRSIRSISNRGRARSRSRSRSSEAGPSNAAGGSSNSNDPRAGVSNNASGSSVGEGSSRQAAGEEGEAVPAVTGPGEHAPPAGATVAEYVEDDDGIEFVRMSNARHDWHRAFLANGRAEDPDANVNAAPDPANLRIRDGLPAGPNRPQHFAPAGVQRAIGVGGARPFAAWQGRGGWAAALGAVGAARGHEDFFAGAGAGRRPAFDESKIPKNYESTMTHKRAARQGFSHDVIEPPTDVENYLTEPTRITGPLPDTTPICPGCRHALVLGVAGKRRLWGLPCGHVLDGRCVERLSHPFSSQPLELTQARARGHGQEHGHGHGKRRTRADAEFELDDEPPAKSTRGAKGKARAVSKGPEESPSSSSLATAAATSTTRPGPLPPPTPTLTVFRCPVAGCGQRVEARPGHRISAFELYI